MGNSLISKDQLQELVLEALQMAAAERRLEKADCEQSARAWERLADAADTLHAQLVREEVWELQGEPTLEKRSA